MKTIVVQVNVKEEYAQRIQEWSEEKGVNKTTVINQVLANHKYIHEKQNQGCVFYIEQENGKTIPVKFN